MPPTETIAVLNAALAGRYEIARELGAGGMATVYLAKDLRHYRNVALKVLRPELAAVIGAERFLAEIKTTANLQHPHILALFDSGQVGGSVFYVMPFVEGESLRDRLAREKQLPIDDALRIAREVGDALEYAHAHGVIHRDIKPENIMLQGGHALVADFGIALAAAKTGDTRMTETGMSLGTPTYMSPEQAMGERTLDARTDVYALGCVLFEMLIGEAPFTGPTAQAIVAKVLTERPRPLRTLRESVPSHVSGAVRRSLEKLPADRFRSAAEFVTALTSGAGLSQPDDVAEASVRGLRRYARPIAIGAGIAVVAFVAGRVLSPRQESAGVPSRLAILAPTVGGAGSTTLGRQIAMTRDGTTIVYVGLDSRGVNSLYRQRLDAPEPTLIQGAAHLQVPQISFDGRWVVGLVSGGSERYRIPLEGGERTAISSIVDPNHGSFGPDGMFWFSSRNVLYRMPMGDTAVRVPVRDSSAITMQQVMDDGKTALIIHAQTQGGVAGVAMLFDLASHDTTRVLTELVGQVRYTDGHLVYSKADGTLFAMPFDVRARRATGTVVQIAQDVSVTGGGAIAQFAVSANGTVAYVAEEPPSLVLVDRDGSSRLATQERRNFHFPQFSPDSKRLSVDFTSADGRSIWILALGQGTMSRATFERDGHDATWAPDGRSIFYATFKNAVLNVNRTVPGSTAPAESLFAARSLGYSGKWIPGIAGGALLVNATDLTPRSREDVAILRNGGKGPLEPLVGSSFVEMYGAASPDGKWLAYVSNQSGRQEVYVRTLFGGSEGLLVSELGGTEPIWGPDSREIFYRGDPAGRVTLTRAAITTTPQLAVSSRTPMFGVADLITSNPHPNYDLSPDGKTFAMVRRSPATRIVVIQNLAALVERLRGAGNRQ